MFPIAWVLLVLAASADPAPPVSGPLHSIEEEQVVTGRKHLRPRAGVLRVRVEDADGRFVPGLGVDDFELNRGSLEVLSVEHRRLEPAIHWLFETMQRRWERVGAAGEVEPPWGEHPWERKTASTPSAFAFWETVLRLVLERHPGGVSNVSQLSWTGPLHGSFEVDGEKAAWLDNGRLLELLEQGALQLLPESEPFSTHRDRRLPPGLTRLVSSQPAASLDHLRIEVPVVSGLRGAPFGHWLRASCEVFRRGFVPVQDAEYRKALYAAETRPYWLREAARRRYLTSLAGLGPSGCENVWLDTVYGDLRDFGAHQNSTEGWTTETWTLRPEEIAQRMSERIESELDQYWIAWKTPDERGSGQTFVRLRLNEPELGRVVPDSFGEVLLTMQDRYTIPYQGDLDAAPWDIRRRLFPEESELVARAAVALLPPPEGVEYSSSESCPLVLLLQQAGPEARARLADRLAAAVAEELGDEAANEPLLQVLASDSVDGAPVALDACSAIRRLIEAGSASG